MERFDPSLIYEYYRMGKTDPIIDFDIYIELGAGIIIRKKIIKYITDQRKVKDHMSIAEIIKMFRRIRYAVLNKEIDIPNQNPRNSNSRIIGKFYKRNKKGLLIILIGDKEVLNAYYRRENEYIKLKNS